MKDGVFVHVAESGYGAGTFEVESARKHRTPVQQRLFRIIEKVIRPRHRVTQCLVTRQATP
jgi:hypothetical protein